MTRRAIRAMAVVAWVMLVGAAVPGAVSAQMKIPGVGSMLPDKTALLEQGKKLVADLTSMKSSGKLSAADSAKVDTLIPKANAVNTELAKPDGSRRVELTGDGSGNWLVDGQAARPLDGCLDVDLWPTPFTNSLPIRRLQLRPGQTAELLVAFVLAPELEVSAKPQRYTCHGATAFRFEALDDGFIAELAVDEHGLVFLYPGLFRKIA